MSRLTGICGAASVAMLALAFSAGPASGAASPSPTVSWPAPGARAKSAQPLTISGSSLTVRPLPSPLVLIDENVEKVAAQSFTVNADVLFDTGKAELTSAAGQSLTELAGRITKEDITGKANVVGNTDDVGTPASNLTLYKQRAAAVTARLSQLLSGRDITLTAVGKGETDPLVPNRNDASRALNRRVSVIFTGTQRKVDPTDISVPSTQPAPAADPSTAPEGSLIGTERTFTLGSERTKWGVRLDVTAVQPIGSTMIAIDTQTSVLSGPPDQLFTENDALFSGSTYNPEAHATAIYDRSANQLLPVVIDGKGKRLESDHAKTFLHATPDEVASDWLLFPRPKDMSSGTIQLYLPGLGVLPVPVKA